MTYLCVCSHSVIISNNGSVLGKTRKNHIPRVGDFNEVRILINLISLLANKPCLQARMSFPHVEKKFLLFTLGAIYRTNAHGAEQILETNNLNQT